MRMRDNHFTRERTNRFLSIVFILMLCFGLTFGGCTNGSGGSTEGLSPEEIEELKEQGQIGEDGQVNELLNYIRGFKATYRTESDNSSSVEQNDSYVYSVNNKLYDIILSYLQASYGYGTFNTEYEWLYKNFISYRDGNLEDGVLGNIDVFYDSIRTYVYGDNSFVDSEEIGWKWGINGIFSELYLEYIPALTPAFLKYWMMYEGDISSYENWLSSVIEEETSYMLLNNIYEKYNQIYALAIQLNMYEVLLGKQITEFDVNIVNDLESSTFKTELKIKDFPDSPFISIKYGANDAPYTINKAIYDRLIALESEYYAKSAYSGFTKLDADNLIEFILNNIIGADAVETDMAYSYFGGSNTFNLLTLNTKNTKISDVSGREYTAKDSYRNYIANVTHIVYSLLSNGTYEFNKTLELKIGEKTYYVDMKEKYVTKKGDDTSFQVLKLKIEYKDPDTNLWVTEENGKFTATPATFVRDFIGTTFLESGEEGDAYKDIPRAEYQSFIMMTREPLNAEGQKEPYDFLSYIMSMEAYSKDLKMNVVGRFNVFDPETNDSYMFQSVIELVDFENSDEEEINGVKRYYNDFEFSIPDFKTLLESTQPVDGFYVYKNGITVEPADYSALLEMLLTKGYLKYNEEADGYSGSLSNFNNSNDALNEYNGTAKDELLIEARYNKITGEAKKANSLIYKTISSSGNYGGISVLDETKVNFSYFELVFDIQKNPDDPVTKDYTFKPAIVMF